MNDPSDTPPKQLSALVTGASRGIGAAVLARLAADGHRVLGTATSTKGAAAISATGHGAGLVYDAADPEAAAALAAQTGAVDVLVCNAGITRDGMFMRMGDDDVDAVLGVNLAAPLRLARAYVRAMAKARFGRIILMSSVIARLGNAGQANYAAAKAGLEGLARALAREFGSRDITVNAVAPGFIETDMTAKALTGELKEKLLAQIPLGRVGSCNDVAAVVAFLASKEAGYVTGATIPVNGGLLMP